MTDINWVSVLYWAMALICIALLQYIFLRHDFRKRARKARDDEEQAKAPPKRPQHPAQARVADPVKRRSLQPGTQAQATLRVEGSTPPTPAVTRARDTVTVRDDMGVEHEVTITALPAPVAVPITQDETKRRHLQPHGEGQAHLEKLSALEDQGFNHKFYGSQLIVGSVILARSLNKGLHVMEITANNQLFIDNNPFPANPSDLVRVKEELAKLRQ